MSKQVTFAQIAEYTGYSKATISRYFNHPETLTIKTREIIRKALKDLNYQENKLARVLANGKSEFIGIIVPNLYMDYYSEIMDLILSTYPQHHYKFLIFQGNRDQELEMEYIHELLAYQIQGLIILSPTIPSIVLRSLDLPVVVLEREDEYISSVRVNNRLGGELAARHLLDQDCDVYIHINSHVPKSSPPYGRIEGFESVLAENGKSVQYFLGHFGDQEESARKEVRRIFEEIEEKIPADKVKGIFLSNDTFASMLLNLIVQKYKHLPDTWRIIGFDNTKASSSAIYPITTIAQPKQSMVESLLELLERQIERTDNGKEPIDTPHKEVKEPYLIIRETTRPPED